MNNHLNMLPKQAKFYLKCSKMRWRGSRLWRSQLHDAPPVTVLAPLMVEILATGLHGFQLWHN